MVSEPGGLHLLSLIDRFVSSLLPLPYAVSMKYISKNYEPCEQYKAGPESEGILFLSLRKSLQSIDTRNENILNTTIVDFSDYIQLEFGTLILREPHPQNLFQAVHINSNNQVNRLVLNMALGP